MDDLTISQTQESALVFCALHPQTETSLRCNRCERPICSKCAVRTPIGYRCPDCVRGQQKSFDTAQWYDYPLVFVLAGILSFVGSQLVRYLGFFTLFVGPIAGLIIAEAIRLIIQRRRSKLLFQLSALATALGSLPLILLYLAGALLGGSLTGSGGFGLAILWPLLWQGIYTFSVTSSVYYRLRGIQI